LGVGMMASARYYQEQAELLLGWALVASDPRIAAKLNAQAMEYLALAKQSDDPATRALHRAIDAFNHGQLTKP
jgi:hypothetical protein